jgi:hypothetical protein
MYTLGLGIPCCNLVLGRLGTTGATTPGDAPDPLEDTPDLGSAADSDPAAANGDTIPSDSVVQDPGSCQ